MLERVTDAIPIEFLSFLKREVHNRKINGGDIVYIVLSGSDLYGFPSIDSDYDYRGAYIVQGNHLLGMHTPVDTIKLTAKFNPDDANPVEVEFFELKKELGLAIGMNCNVIEHLTAPAIYNTAIGIELRTLVSSMLSKKGLYNSYRGLGLFNYKKFILSGKKNTVKKYLYVYRGLLAGIHVLETETIQPNIEKLAEYFDFDEVKTLIEMKKDGVENMAMNITELKLQKAVEDRLKDLFTRMDEAYIKSNMQDTPTHDQLEAADKWLRRTRRNLLLYSNTAV